MEVSDGLLSSENLKSEEGYSLFLNATPLA